MYFHSTYFCIVYLYDLHNNSYCYLLLNRSEIDATWTAIAKAVVSGTLGFFSKVFKPPDEKDTNYVICVYTEDFTKKRDVWVAEKRLRELGITETLRYKPDVYTTLGIYPGNEWGIRPTIYESRACNMQEKLNGASGLQSMNQEHAVCKSTENCSLNSETMADWIIFEGDVPLVDFLERNQPSKIKFINMGVFAGDPKQRPTMFEYPHSIAEPQKSMLIQEWDGKSKRLKSVKWFHVRQLAKKYAYMSGKWVIYCPR